MSSRAEGVRGFAENRASVHSLHTKQRNYCREKRHMKAPRVFRRHLRFLCAMCSMLRPHDNKGQLL